MNVASVLPFLTILCLLVCCWGQSAVSTPLSPGSCCVRRSKLLTLGRNLTGGTLTVDVGECINTCRPPNNSTLSRQTCPGSCYAKKTVVERYYAINHIADKQGPQNVNVIKWCACDRSERLNKCRRMHKWMVYFHDTPNERAVNVGHCAGNSPCQDDQGNYNRCRVVETANEIVHGPNGGECVSVIRKCQCAASCYRMSEYQNVRESYQNEKGETKTRWKRLDVGRCSGVCPQSCYWLCPSPVSVRVCSPQWSTPTQYRTKDNKPVNVINRCSCTAWS